MKYQDVTKSPCENAYFLVFNLNYSPENRDILIDFCNNFSGLIRSMRTRFPELETSCVMGFGAKAWTTLFPNQPKPKELNTFKEIKGDTYTAVSTPGDLFFHIRALKVSACYELASIISQKLKDIVTPVDEVHGFRYFDGRSIIGFVDGTENPEYEDERASYAVIGDEDPEFTGGSYAFVQKYIHDMEAWEKQPLIEQEKVIGRHKFNDVELTDEEKEPGSHNVVTNIQNENGEDLKIVRANMPFSNPSQNEYGTYFIGYARYFSTTNRMLENMFAGTPEGHTDKLLKFSTPVTGTLFFVPSPEFLDDLA
ncbi:Dyp-type peroxidase [Proteus hauseri]|uniref:Dyp-type peroxidase n=1 Tax=Proteus cibi TaxID=2050966 RepID=A0ABU6EHE3_9GAMM|nr:MULTISPECIES: Dyp-type peroxidase [Proteus]EST58009.1 peroxidase [Proteus hauseri ZMd44]MBG6031267.1 Dyp-type peroxidase [Proteus hauseri]MBS6209977.1 Dyp-type peroxidase [Proteus hauseri]MEB6858469.1 Dyp-type peroxidase [Proteus cibi]MEB7090108.1 Dyp-type peroxidase [Proteus cibi]